MRRSLNSFLLLLLLVTGVKVHAQYTNTLYWLDNTTVQHQFNPSFQPYNNFYIGIPLLNRLSANGTTTFPTFKAAGFTKGQAFVYETDKQLLSNALPSLLTTGEMLLDIGLLDFGFRYNSHYFTFTLSERFDITGQFPKGSIDLLMNGSELSNGISTTMDMLTLQSKAYTELSFGYSHHVSDKVGFGAKLKLLAGSSYLSMNASKAMLNINNDKIDAQLAMNVNSTGLISLDQNLRLQAASGFSNYLKPAGIGGAVDLGVFYKPLSFVKLALAVTDLGLLQWSELQSSDYTLDYKKDANDWASWVIEHPGQTTIPSDTIWSELQQSIVHSSSELPGIQHYLRPRMNGSAEIEFLNNRLSIGALYAARMGEGEWRDELTGALTIRPAQWINLAFSYSMREGRGSNVGFGAGIRAKKINFYFAADYIPFQTVKMNLQQFNEKIPSINYHLAFDKQRINFSTGISIVMGSWQDSDKDGVSDIRDKCENTPAGIRVDSRGCPRDSDKDGVPDYLDKCPNTSKEARNFVDANGCPLDTDGDGIPDFRDKCPDNAPEAKGFVDAEGCPIDSDNDGVFDYRDKCPNTPQGIEVDEWGCPLDTDQDGVPDYLDLCPDTPAAAYGFVDKNGCPTDKDDDGVLDYLDLCPDTPIEARGYVDINGCLIDLDDDGVPDYRDDCKNTPFEARGTVDHRGCPKDSDFDGIPDYRDDCPKIPGVESNNGCPEVKTEISSLLRSALMGIQFDEDSMQIASKSYPMLDQIELMLKQNESYKLLIQGHTDNVVRKMPQEIVDSTLTDVQKKEKIAEYYALLVKNYLVKKGISEQRLYVIGFGDTKPSATNSTAQGRARNRRVELSIVFDDVLSQ